MIYLFLAVICLIMAAYILLKGNIMPKEMRNIYRDNFKPVKFVIFDSNEEKYEIEQKTMLLPSVSNDIEEILKDTKTLTGDKMIDVMIRYFGEDREFWEKISITLMTQILNDFNESQKKS